MKSQEPFFFPELPDEQLGVVNLKEINIGTQTFKVLQPAAPDGLLDQASVHAALIPLLDVKAPVTMLLLDP